VPSRDLSPADLVRLARGVDAAFTRLYGFLPPHRIPQIVTLRVFVRRSVPPAPFPLDYTNLRPAPQTREYRPVVFPGARVARCPVLDRSTLVIGRSIRGPAVIEDDYSTVVIFPGQRGSVDRFGNLVIQLKPQR
jgi:N-methylhydantoinase A